MTKESKLALIIGFVLVLVVGVLVSDHFSQASKMSHDTLEPGEAEVSTPIASLGDRDRNAINSIPSNRPVVNQPREQPPVEISNRNPRGNSTGSSILDRIHDAATNADIPAAMDTKKREEPRTQPITRPVVERPQKLPEPKTVFYKVETGDSLIRIARKMLGDGKRYTEIEALNADKLGPDLIVRVGMTLKLPSDAKIITQGSDSSTKPYAPAGGSTYTVKSGDTLGEIASNLLGTSKRMDEIVELNGLESADKIFVGMELKIPAK